MTPNPKLRIIRLLILGSTICTLAASSGAQVGRVTNGGSFFDDFSTFDRKRWFVSDGWSNGPHQHCTWSASNIRRTKNTISVVLNNRQGRDRPFSCGELQTAEVYQFGTFEMRMRPAAGPGLVSSFFTYTRLANGAGHEQISFDFVGKDRRAVLLTHSAAGKGNRERTVELGFEPSTTMADYAFQWTPDALRWFVNGDLVHEVKRDPNAPFPTNPAKLFLSIRNGTGPNEEAWLGHFEYENEPFVTTFEYVAFTELGKPCRFPSSVLCKEKIERMEK